jgi:hypothetical protein
VLGEPLDVLLDAASRLRCGIGPDGTVEISGSWTPREAEALARAMARIAIDEPADRPEGLRNVRRFLRVADQVVLATRVALNQASPRSARVLQPYPWVGLRHTTRWPDCR